MRGWLRNSRRLHPALPSERLFSRRKPAVERLEDRCLLAGNITEFAVPTTGGSPFGIATGPDNNLWFTEQSSTNTSDQIGQITPAGSFQLFPYGISGTLPEGITAGPDNALWFLEAQPLFVTPPGNIGRIDTSGNLSSRVIGPRSSLHDITLGPNNNLWFTDAGNNSIGQTNPTGGGTSETSLGIVGFPEGIVTGPDKNIWFTNPVGNTVAIFTATGAVTQFTIPTAGSQPTRITVGPDNNLWFTEPGSNNIGTINLTTHKITEFVIPTANSGPFGITSAPDGALWFTEGNANQIGRITTSGAVTEFAVPTARSQPNGITSGPDGNVWFTELAANKIGRIAVSRFNGTGLAICAFAGVPLHNFSVASFTDTTATDVPFTYSAAINWGDGTPATPGTVSKTATGFAVAGDHVYNTEGNLPVTITVTRSDKVVLVINTSANVGGFITSLYQEVLVRAPDAPGLQFWLQLEHAGVSHTVIANGFWISPEHRGLEVDQFYVTFLHRPADAAGRADWVNALINGATEIEVAIGFLTSPEYTSKHLDVNSYVTGLYTDVFGRAPDAVGLSGWDAVLQQGSRSRAAVAYYFLTSGESFVRAIIDYYQQFLGRVPNSAEIQAFFTVLSNGATPAAIVSQFLSSDEFLAREIAMAAACGPA